MSSPHRIVQIFNRQRARPIPKEAVLRVVDRVLDGNQLSAELGIHFISPRESALLNRRHLNHEGPTDILTFDQGGSPDCLRGELFICVEEADRQAREFRTTWRQELLRYVIHGILHLRGFDDLDPAGRRVMKREENRLVRKWVAAPRKRPRP
ncbi:MAG: rRNA maturation RNase YbeY [Verrucomicrobiales bacterium]|nr:rRNA maturation RNase YbeY [Verrucomicrobiales bacterium]